METKSCSPRASGGPSGLSAYQETLSVSLIATPRADFLTCAPSQSVAEVRALAEEGGFDHVPIAVAGDIVGVLGPRSLRGGMQSESVEAAGDPLAEKYLVGAGTSILDFIEQAAEHPFRLLVTNQGISGLVSISDIQHLASRASLFALVTQLEMSMMDVIRKRFGSEGWRSLIGEERLEKAVALWDKARESSRHVDLLTYTQFCDKSRILEGLVPATLGGVSKKQYRVCFERFRRIRDALAHANAIEASTRTCHTVGSMREWIKKLEEISQ